MSDLVQAGIEPAVKKSGTSDLLKTGAGLLGSLAGSVGGLGGLLGGLTGGGAGMFGGTPETSSATAAGYFTSGSMVGGETQATQLQRWIIIAGVAVVIFLIMVKKK